ncbi:hypothetical protein [Wolbachia endosymbiont of Dirofilaria (Dirofilaria) immitis]|uniref:hypothetical protein n=1 Tax=Wolbachia endosymbiont of Dirofilaria (Dirofilaria) immitis TaxID=1812115 RepID=UPI00158D565D|nr:hypothetical protein [Wolbachia endosymbiont of Dirofilaria (Dirofilaria) immitis]QKX02154.1 hypothetical protein GOY12_00995 [Wolbachia endosymbiont of Dirofilaria (Dirofilaria) immitis]
MCNNENQTKQINKKWHIIAASSLSSSLLFITMLSSIFLLARIAARLIIASIIAIAIKITSKAALNILKGKQAYQNQITQKTTQDEITNLAIGLISTFVGWLSLLIAAQTWSTAAAYAAIAALALRECFKGEEIGKSINDKLDEAADSTTNFVISSVEKFISSQNRQV